MVRIIIKGGSTPRTRFLKAAIAKYGKNQWARISSLLVRKTPKQCKARWYEWLDPSIKKTEWSKTEDEKLLHLAKLMPTQWRTIAPIVGRTATQCLERYQKLLDEAEAKENEELGLTGPKDTGPSADDVRRLRPGEIDPDPETKPARPDPIDMDEDARARLANTQGKKAKRKARERQLEEARRLAVLQKKRELKAAGIIMRHKTKLKGMDYNADIPFEKKAAPGFYDTSEEQARVTSAPIGQSLRRLENKRKTDDEEAERRKRQRQGSVHQTKFVPARDAQIQKLKEADSIGRRRKLELPGAQVGEAELEEIVKIGQTGENAKALVNGGSEATSKLLGEYEGLDGAKMARTPRTAPQQDNVMMEARNLRNMTIAQTPLLGDENTPLHTTGDGTGFEGATPRHQSMAGATPLRTPMRDNLSINPETGMVTGGETPREQRLRTDSAKRALKAGFMSLPKPENNFELLVPEDEEEEPTELVPAIEEDAAQRDARLKRVREEEERKALARRSKVIQLGLPRPARVNLSSLILHDSIVHPLPGTNLPGGTVSSYVLPPDEDLARAKSMGLQTLSKNEEVDETCSWAHQRQRLAFNPHSKIWVDPQMAGYTSLLKDCREQMTKEDSKTSKIEKKLGITLGGYQVRSKALVKRVTDAFDELVKTKFDYESFSRLASNEAVAGPRRVGSLKEEVEILARRERLLQERDAESRVAALEEKLMEEAEALNEAALAEVDVGA
ncbi:pre-mRNA splicing factor component-domain-containing protein [Pisolithus microcarpus]|nr:pre-mRNA splicing factor component-domain-containing protein [Pisolithus microcarpus]